MATTMEAARRGSQIVALKFWFGLDRGPASVLSELFSAGGSYVRSDTLAALCGQSPMGVRRRIHELRTAMRTEAVDTKGGCYALTSIGLEECQEAFDAIVADLPKRAA